MRTKVDSRGGVAAASAAILLLYGCSQEPSEDLEYEDVEQLAEELGMSDEEASGLLEGNASPEDAGADYLGDYRGSLDPYQSYESEHEIEQSEPYRAPFDE